MEVWAHLDILEVAANFGGLGSGGDPRDGQETAEKQAEAEQATPLAFAPAASEEASKQWQRQVHL